MTVYTPRHEDITGASLTGSDGTVNRTYTLANSNSVLAQMQLIVAENVLMNTVNFTFASGVITFLGKVWDDQNISIDYFTTGATTSGSYYCDTLQITRASGLGLEVVNENVGTGDNSATSYDLDNGNVISGSYTLKHAATGSNSFTTMVESTHYTISKDGGSIELTSAGVTELGTDILYADYVYSPRHSDTLLATYLPQATAEVDKLTGNYWGSVTTAVQYFDGYDSGYPQTDEPYGTQIQPYAEFELKYKGVATITSVLFLDREGNTDSTLDSGEYRIVTDDDFNDSRLLINRTIPNGKNNVKVTFTHGYDTVPDLVQELTSLLGGLMALANISGGSYKDISTYSFPEGSVSIGQIYVNVRESIIQMNNRIKQILETLGNNFDCA